MREIVSSRRKTERFGEEQFEMEWLKLAVQYLLTSAAQRSHRLADRVPARTVRQTAIVS